jgi:protein-tyrosine-phosphatase
MSDKKRVLILCTGNSARRQMAEGACQIPSIAGLLKCASLLLRLEDKKNTSREEKKCFPFPRRR